MDIVLIRIGAGRSFRIIYTKEKKNMMEIIVQDQDLDLTLLEIKEIVKLKKTTKKEVDQSQRKVAHQI